MDNYFNTLQSLDFNDKKKQKNNLTYLSWAYAWGALKTNFPDATYKIYERNLDIEVVQEERYPEQKLDVANAVPASPETIVRTTKRTTIPVNYFTDGRTCWVKVGVTVNGIEHIEELPIMDNRNKAIAASAISSTEVNKSIQRALTKAIARHGVGLYIYANEDLPMDINTKAEDDGINVNDNFEDIKREVIDLVTGYFNTGFEMEVDKFIRNLFGATRISETTVEDMDKLIAAKNYLVSLNPNNE